MDRLPPELEAQRENLARLWLHARPGHAELRAFARELVRSHADHPWPWLALAEVEAADGQPDATRDAVLRATELAPDDEGVALYGAESLLEAGCRETAEEVLERIRTLGDMENAVVAGRVAGLEASMRQDDGDTDGAERLFRQALDLFPGYGYHWRGLAQLLAAQDRVAEAVAIAREGRRRFPDDVELAGLVEVLEPSDDEVVDAALAPAERDLALIAARHSQDPMLSVVVDLGLATDVRIGLLVNGMVMFGDIASPKELADVVDRAQARVFARATKPRDMSDEAWRALGERMASSNGAAVADLLAQRQAVRDQLTSLDDPTRIPGSLERRRIEFETRVTLTLRNVTVRPGEGAADMNLPIVRVSDAHVVAWWLLEAAEEADARM
jgi:tetratricopeptide (TPR) repeat protein